MAIIKSKTELSFYLMADRMINKGAFRASIKERFIDFFFPDYIMRYLIAMRKYSYYSHKVGFLFQLNAVKQKVKLKKIGLKLGFSIGPNTLGYGVRIPHFGTIVIGDSNSIGNYAVIHTSTCITSNNKVIGDGLYLSTGAKLTSNKIMGSNVIIAANSVVTKNFTESNIVLAGMPASIKKKSSAWYENNNIYKYRVQKIEDLKKKINL